MVWWIAQMAKMPADRKKISAATCMTVLSIGHLPVVAVCCVFKAYTLLVV
jgi:hypothetical protein